MQTNGSMQSFYDLIKKHKYILILTLTLFISLFIYFGLLANENKNYEQYTVTRKNLDQAISLTGRVKASQEANLSFEKTGVVKSVNVVVGQQVKMGDVLATLSEEDANARVQEAQAAVLSQKALLEDLTTGARAETIDNKKAALDKAENDLRQAYKNAGDSLRNTAISGNTYVRDNLASSYSGSLTNGYKINVNTCDAVTEGVVSALRGEAEKALLEIENANNNFSSYELDNVNQSQILSSVKNVHIKTITKYLDTLRILFSAQCSTSNSNLDATRTLISSSRTAWSAISADLSLKLSLIENAKTALTQAKNDLIIAQSGEKGEKVKQQEANVKTATARLSQALAEANKNILRAPFPGIITNIDVKLGELITPGGKSISLISQNNFEIESRVSEVDVAKLRNGAMANITFDTYGDSEKFSATISNISPAGIITEGVPTYQTIFVFTNQDERIRSGMTANINVITETKESVLSIPAKFINSDKGEKSVKVKLPNGDIVSQSVETGALGTNGEVEILKGIFENQVVITDKELLN